MLLCKLLAKVILFLKVYEIFVTIYKQGIKFAYFDSLKPSRGSGVYVSTKKLVEVDGLGAQLGEIIELFYENGKLLQTYHSEISIALSFRLPMKSFFFLFAL